MLEQNVAVSPPTIPAAVSATASAELASPSLPSNASLPNIIVIHAASTPANAVHMPDIRFTAKAMSAGLSETSSAIQVNIRPTSKNIGAPGGCTTCSLYAPSMNSPQSHRLPVRSADKKKTVNEIRKTAMPAMLKYFLSEVI